MAKTMKSQGRARRRAFWRMNPSQRLAMRQALRMPLIALVLASFVFAGAHYFLRAENARVVLAPIFVMLECAIFSWAGYRAASNAEGEKSGSEAAGPVWKLGARVGARLGVLGGLSSLAINLILAAAFSIDLPLGLGPLGEAGAHFGELTMVFLFFIVLQAGLGLLMGAIGAKMGGHEKN